MKYLDWLDTTNPQLLSFSEAFTPSDLLRKKRLEDVEKKNKVLEIKSLVQQEWDIALRKLTEKYDTACIQNFLVSDIEWENIDFLVAEDVKNAINQAMKNIYTFHLREMPANLSPQETSPWIRCWREFRAIESVWLYVPGWSAPLFSTVLMLGIPAKIAGCTNISLCTPPNPDGSIAPEILYCAKLLGIRNIYKVWWAQAIFALAYWTEQIWKVNKIFWPGNQYVTYAKMEVANECAIDMPAWPSEVLVIADENADPSFVAADLLSQCEHGPDSQSVLISNSEKIIQNTLIQCQRQLSTLSRQTDIQWSLANSFSILTKDLDEAIDISNIYAPEHLILQMDSWRERINAITNAWSVFCGKYSPESAGDYLSGTNHTLPTSGFAKTFSGIGVESFGKWVTFQELTKQWITNVGTNIQILAEKEWLQAHANAAKIRMDRVKF